MQLSIGVTSGMPLEQIIETTELTEKAGLKGMWVGEDIAAHHDIFTVASVTLLESKRTVVGIGITSPLVRNISTIARASVTLAETGGYDRFRLGLGIGGLRDLAGLGITVKNPARILRDATTLLRQIWKGETVRHKSQAFTLEEYYTRYSIGSQIPIFFGVRGPQLLRLAGQLADGVILSGPKTYLKKAIATVSDSIQTSQNPRREFRFAVWIPTILQEKSSDVNLVKRTILFVLADTPGTVLEMANLDSHDVEKIRRTYVEKGIAKASSLVTNDIIEEFAISGDAEKLLESFKSLEKMGAHEVVFGPPFGADSKSAIRKVAQAWSGFS